MKTVKARLVGKGRSPAFAFGLGLLAMAIALPAAAAVIVDNKPLFAPTTVPGNLVLVPSVEWPTVVTQANAPGVAETSANYAPATAYAGYFNVNLCYAYQYDPIEANRYFYPVEAAGTNHSCAGKTGGTPARNLWSGNYLNWVAMQAIDTFRLALTGGYRVHRPSDGTPPNVSITVASAAGFTTVSKATSEMPNVTYLEKANSDRWDDNYTKLRRMTTADGNVDDATPYTGNTGFRARIGALRNQMWFTPRADGAMGSGRAYNDPRALALPITDGDQAEPGGATGTGLPAIAYNPTYHTLPNADTSTVVNDTACGVDEQSCTPTTPLCSVGSWNGSACVSTSSSTVITNPAACPVSSRPNFRTATGRCHQNNNNTSSSVANSCPAETTTTVGTTTTTVDVTLPTSNGSGRTCTVRTTTSTTTTGTATLQYQHTIYGRNQVYAVSIRVKVCDGTLDTRDICTQYGSNYKPEGLLQKNALKIRYSLFSYLTESGQVRDGGVMRARQKLIAPVTAAEQARTTRPYPDRDRITNIDNPEWDPVTGVLIDNPDTTDTTATNDDIGNCGTSAPDGSQCVIQYSGVINYLNRFGQILTGQPTLKSFDNLSEMYYVAMRYLRGLANITTYSSLTKLSGSDLSASGTLAKYQNADGLPVIDDWFKTGANTAVRRWDTSPAISVGTDGDPMLYQCQTSVILGIGDTSTNNEDDTDNKTKDSTAAGSTWRSYTEFSSGGNGRGNMAGLAYWAHLNDMRTDVPNNDVAGGAANAKRGQTLSTYWVDVVERNDLFANNTNQYYNATKFGGYNIPPADWDENGNALRHDANWFSSNQSTWTSATQTVKTVTGLGGSGNYYLPNNMFLANNGQAMIDGLNAAFRKIASDLAGSGASLAANSTKLETGTTTYQAIYYTGNWQGDIKAFTVNPTTGVIAITPSWTASNMLPAAASRVIKAYNPDAAAGSQFVDFSAPTGLSAAQRTALGADSTAQQRVINYLRGDATYEQKNGGTFRNRDTPLGDIINSQPVFVGAPNPNVFFGKTFTGSSSYATFASNNVSRSPRIWVAANDGMLHAFNSATGVETLAYLPGAVITANLKDLANPNYGNESLPHQFYNDGEITVADVYYDSAWHSVLVGTTGRGTAKAIYALDITDPAAPALLWERSAGDGQTNSDYIGQITGKPVIAQTADGSWSVLVGNGYNSTANKAALLRFAIKTGTLNVHTTNNTTNNGLAPPAVWMDNAVDGISTKAYAGDLLGNVWAFNLSATSGTTLFTARDSSSTAQPITAGMLAGQDPKTGNLWLFFGTGKFLTQTDLASTSVQTWYGIIGQAGAGQPATLVTNLSSGRSALTQRTIVGERAATSSSLAARAISSPSANDMAGKSGWYIDLKISGGTARGERMTTSNQFQGSLLLGTSRIPESSDPCNPSGSGWIMAIDPFSGAPPSSTFFDINNDGQFNDSDKITIDGTTYIVAGVGFTAVPNNPIFVGNTMLISFDNASTGRVNTAGTLGQLQRQSWRELVQ